MKLLIVIPAYNEAENIERVMTELKETVPETDYVIVNDGSGDDTLKVMRALAADDPRVKYLSFARNFGKESAMYAGLCNAAGDYVAIMDADLQDPPRLLPKMLALLESGEYDSVATRRADRRGEPVLRSWFARQFYRLINRFSDTEIVDGARDFRLMTREMAQAVVRVGEYNRFSKGIFGWVGFRTCWLSYDNVERVAGKTKWNFWQLLRYGLDGIVNFSQTPLYLASWFGLFMTLISVLALLFIVVRRLIWGDPVAGWASTVCVVVFIGGIQMCVLGILGQYLARIYLETKSRPHYIVSESSHDSIRRIG